MNATNTMTLGRFVRVTLNNFRLLMRNINAPLTSPMTNSPDDAQHLRNNVNAAPLPVAPAQIAPAQIAPAQIAPTQIAPTQIAPAQIAPTQIAPTPAMTPARGDPASDPAVRPTLPDAGIAVEIQPDGAHAAAGILIDGRAGEKLVEDDLAENDLAENDLAENDTQVEALAQATATGLTLPAVIESLLFVAAGPVEPAQLARACSVAPATVEQGLRELAEHYRSAGRGLRVQERAGRYQLVTAPETGALVEAFLQVDVTARLSGPALEALAVIAYRQPVTRAQIEAVRGVDCSGVLRSLVQRGLVEETGRLEAPGRPVLYGVTDLFLHHFGLTSLHELPPLAIGEQDRMDEVLRDSVAALLTGAPAAA